MQDVLNTAIQCHRSGQLEPAARLYRQVLAHTPDHVDALHNLALALQDLRRYDKAVEQSPASAAKAHNRLACVLRKLGQADEALMHFQRAVELAPDDFLAQINLGQMLLSIGRAEQAVPHCREAVRLQPQTPLLHLILGDALRCTEGFEEAQTAYLQAVRLQPTLAQAYANLGLLYRAQHKLHEAFTPLRQAVALEPNNASFWKYLAEAHADWAEFRDATRCWQRVLNLQPEWPAAYLGLASALQEEGRYTEAEKQMQTALRLEPDSAEVQFGLGSLHEQVGATAEAENAFRAVLRLHPGDTAALVHLAALRCGRLSDSDRTVIEQRLADSGLGDHDRVELLFALVAVLDAQGDYSRTANWARQANALHGERSRRWGGYDPVQHKRFVADTQQAFGPAFFMRMTGAGLATQRPVFIVGLPRSGTTLVEQILASHGRVHGAGELYLAWETLMAIPKVLGRDSEPLQCIPALEASAMQQLGEQHLARLTALDDGRADRIIDKLPENYLFLGLLAALFPRAVFIHCRRDLRDVALSCWLTHFRWLQWSNDIGHIRSRIAEYGRLMNHWREVLPVTLHEVDYEDIVDDLEGTARKLVAACGLEWEPACLEFHRTRRPVRTASATQVRTPIYQQSVGRWKHYERHLAELFGRV